MELRLVSHSGQKKMLQYARLVKLGKHTELQFQKSAAQNEHQDRLIWSKRTSVVQLKCLDGARCFVAFVDNYFSLLVVFPIMPKPEAKECYLQYEKPSEQQTGRQIQTVRSDRRGENLSDELRYQFSARSIGHQLTTACSPHKNDVAERTNQTSLNLGRDNSWS